MALLSTRYTAGVCSHFVLKYFILSRFVLLIAFLFFSRFISSFSCAVALLRFVASLRRFASWRFASRRFARALFSPRRVSSCSPASLRFRHFRFLSLAALTGVDARPRFDLMGLGLEQPRYWGSVRPTAEFPASIGPGNALRSLGLRLLTLAFSW